MPTLAREGVTLSYQDLGSGTPLLLLHAFPLSSEAFWPQLATLSKRCRLIVPDHRGFGASSAGEGPTEMETLAKDALAILDAAGVSSAVVGGVSMGGYAAMALTLLDPGRVRGLVLVDTQATADDEAGKVRREELARTVEAQGPRALVDAMLPKLLAPEVDPKVRARVERIILATSARGAAAALRGMALRQDSRELLARFAGPALVVVGERDTITPVEKSRQMAELLSRSKLVELPGAGHLSNLESPEGFDRALEELLGGL